MIKQIVMCFKYLSPQMRLKNGSILKCHFQKGTGPSHVRFFVNGDFMQKIGCNLLKTIFSSLKDLD